MNTNSTLKTQSLKKKSFIELRKNTAKILTHASGL